jgi:hypothetical protein
MGVREQIIFPEIDYDSIDQVRGLDVNITTTAKTDEEAFELLRMLGMPFRREAEEAQPAPQQRPPAPPPEPEPEAEAEPEPAAAEDAAEPQGVAEEAGQGEEAGPPADDTSENE